MTLAARPGRPLLATTLSRRGLLAGLVATPALVWGAGPALAAPTAAPTTKTTSSTSKTTSRTAPDTVAAPGPTLVVPTSPNGWAVGTPASSIGVDSLAVAGTKVTLPVSDTAAGVVLLYVARRFHAEVESLGTGCWGYAYRANVNDTAVWSNHASGTAIDLNAPLHPNGKVGTFTSDQQDSIHAMISDLKGVVRWGGDYHSTKDEMHFEINVAPTSTVLVDVAGAIADGSLGQVVRDTEADAAAAAIKRKLALSRASRRSHG